MCHVITELTVLARVSGEETKPGEKWKHNFFKHFNLAELSAWWACFLVLCLSRTVPRSGQDNLTVSPGAFPGMGQQPSPEVIRWDKECHGMGPGRVKPQTGHFMPVIYNQNPRRGRERDRSALSNQRPSIGSNRQERGNSSERSTSLRPSSWPLLQ